MLRVCVVNIRLICCCCCCYLWWRCEFVANEAVLYFHLCWLFVVRSVVDVVENKTKKLLKK